MDDEDGKLFATYKKITVSLNIKELVLKGQMAISGCEIDVVEVESKLNNARSQTGIFKHKSKWRAHTEYTHPLGKTSTAEYGKTRAYLKMIDILQRFPKLLKGKYQKLRTLHLCEAPGNFVAAIADTLDDASFEWNMNSLNPHYEWNDIHGMLTEDAFILGNSDRMFFGEADSGNIFQLNKNDFEKLGKKDLVTCDGSFDCTGNPEDQEKLVCKLIAREAFLAMNALEQGGSLVLKMFTFFRPESREILQRIMGSFEEVHLRKPAPSKPGNSEIYVIAFGYLGQIEKDESTETLAKLDTASSFFANKQVEMIEFNLATFSMSQYLKCQIEQEKQTVVTEFRGKLPAGKYWDLTASTKPFFPIPMERIDVSRIHFAASPFINDAWLRQRKILSVPYESIPLDRRIINPMLCIYDENYPISDFCELQHLKDLNNLYPNSDGSTTFIFTPWILSKKEMINKIMMILSDAEKVIIQSVPNSVCGIISRFSLSIMAILLDTFELDGLPTPGNVILLKRKRYVSPIVMQLLEDVLRRISISEVLCFIPINDLSENFRMFIRIMTDVVEIVLAGERIKRLSDLAIENAVEKNKQKFIKEFASIDSSDLDRHVYEGGLKVWECSYDLSAHLEDVDLNGKKVLELGCGAALPSIVALKKGAAKVICQDYNESVIELVTKPNLKLNAFDGSKFEAIAKSWEAFSKECNEKFDYILTSETIYDAADYASLHDSMNAALKDDGTIILAAKMVYFGKTGDYFRFLDFIESQSIFQVIKSKQIEASVQRIIAYLKRK